jgi:hypothetical protein
MRINGPSLEPLHALFVMLWQKEEWVGELKIPGICIHIIFKRGYISICIYIYVYKSPLPVRDGLAEIRVGGGTQNTSYICVYLCVYIYVYIYIYIYIYILFVMHWQKEEWVGEVKIPGFYIYIIDFK